jgi:hypothetical protein
VVYASELTFAEGIESLPFKAIGYVLVLSVLGGMAATLPKIINPAITIRSIPLEIVKDVVCSFVAGLIIFFAMIELKQTWSFTCLLILLGGAGGAKFIDLLLNNGFFPRVAQFFGKLPDPPMPMAPPAPPAREETPQ